MKRLIRNTILTAAACTAFAAPALADTVSCVVTAPAIRLRKSPSKNAPVLAVLKKGMFATAEGKCEGGWVKVSSADGRLSGYVGGWAIADRSPKTAAAVAPAADVKPASPEQTTTEAAPAVAARKESPTNEMLAVQITELRLKVLGIDRDLDMMRKDIQKLKVASTRSGRRK